MPQKVLARLARLSFGRSPSGMTYLPFGDGFAKVVCCFKAGALPPQEISLEPGDRLVS